MTTRTFEDRPAVRERTPLFVGIVSPSGAGKTYSALRLATGIQRVAGGDIGVIDTEARRALHYAHKFKYRHMSFGAPFSPLDYLAAIEHYVKKGATTIVIDSASHEHEGPGGVLEMHDAELDRMAGQDYAKRDRMNMIAWAKPKAQRRKLINAILQLPINLIMCFRAKRKLKMVRGQQPVELGWMPIAGEEFIYEMSVKFWLMPGAEGHPTWDSEYEGEKAMMKLPEQFRGMFDRRVQLSEDVGEQLARWASGEGVVHAGTTVEDLVARYDACSDPATLRTLEDERQRTWKAIPASVKASVKDASDRAKQRIDNAERTFEDKPAEPPAEAKPPDAA